MAYCSNCGKELAAGAKFCFECGTPVQDNAAGKHTERKTVYSGEIHKCPNCGEVLQSLTAICPSCGHEINSATVSSSLKDFIARINECDQVIADTPKEEKPKKGWKTWSKAIRVLWVILNIFTSCIPLVIYLSLPLIKPLLRSNTVPELTSAEKHKVSLIENFTFPNDRESILEALLFTKSKVAFLAKEKANAKTVYWVRLWNTKATQLHQKAGILLNNDPIAANAYTEIAASKAKVDKRIRTKAGIGIAIVVVFIAFVLINGSLLGGVSNLFKNLNFPAFPLPSIGSNKDDVPFEWLQTGLSTELPEVQGTGGHIWKNSEEELDIDIDGITYAQFDAYIVACQEKGFTVDAVKDTNEYTAYNDAGYKLELKHISDRLYINLKAPLSGDSNYIWPDSTLAQMIPQLSADSGATGVDNEKKCEILLFGASQETLKSYVATCKAAGFAVDCEESSTYYNGYNSNGYFLHVSINDMGKLSITLEAPMEFSEITWPSTGPATLIPEPLASSGNISSDYAWSFSVYIANMTIDDFNDYVDQCIEKGFEKDYRSDQYFSADKGDDIRLTVEYKGFNTVWISIYDGSQVK